MQESRFSDHFTTFPYCADRADGRTNNGGIDLTREPHRISEISEAADFPELQNFIATLNAPDSPVITLGCEAGNNTNGVFDGYVEFCFRQESIANSTSFIAGFDDRFHAWVAETETPEMAAAIRQNLAWEYFRFLYHGTSARLSVAFFYRAAHRQAAGQLLDHVRRFLLQHCPLPA